MEKSAQCFATIGAGAFLATAELLQPENRDRNNETPMDPYTFQRILRTELGNIQLSEKYAARDAHPNDLSGDPLEMAAAAIERLRQENLGAIIFNAFTWANNYQLSEEAAAQLDKSALDCNDDARKTCDQLSKHDIPMYLLSICPSNVRDFFERDWHQMSVCKMGRRYYLIFDNGNRATLWHGTLEEFVEQRDSDVPMCIFPIAGIARYAEPKYDIAFSRFLLQLAHAKTEDDMEWLRISAPLDLGTHFAQLQHGKDHL